MEGRLTLSDSLLTVKLNLRAGALSLTVDFSLTKPWTVLFGPSGSGKTTVLRAVAGFVRPDAGAIVYGTPAMTLVNRETGVFVPAHERPVRSAGQTPRLFPHMTVRENMLYGCHSDKEGEIVEDVLALFRLTALADRMPRDLSGGEKQRASVARAVASAIAFKGPGTALLLLDEPFNGLDLRMRDQLIVELQRRLREWNIPVLSVTHDVGEAFQLGAEVIKISNGTIVQQGPVGTALAEERERLLAQLSRTM